MAVGFNPSSDIGGILNMIGEYILGDVGLIGIWILIIFIALGLTFKIDFTLLLVFMIPLVIVSMTFGLIYPAIGGTILLFNAFILSANFFFRRE